MPIIEIPGIGDVEFPDDMQEADILKAIQNDILPSYRPAQPAYVAPQPEPETGFIPSLKEGAIGALQSTVRGVTAPFQSEESIRADIAQQQAEAEQRNVGMTTFADVRAAEGVLPTIGKTYEFARDALGQSLPYMAPTLAGAATGARLGAVGGPLGAITGGILGGIMGGTPMFAGQNIQRRVAEETPGALVDPEVYGTAALQATLDTAGGAITLGKGIVSRIIGKDLMRVSDDELAAVAQRSLAKTVGGAAARGAAVEMPTEIAQQMLERRQAGLSLTSDDALAEYGEAGAAAFILGGALGGVGGVATRSGARTQQEQRAAYEQAGYDQGERARQQFAEEAGMAADVTAERQADLAGFAEANKAYTEAAAKAMETSAAVRQVIPQGFAVEQINKLDTVEGTQDLLANFDDFFDMSPADAKQVKAGLQKNLIALRRKEAEAKKVSPEEKDLATTFDAYSKLGVGSQQELESMPLEQLQGAMDVLQNEIPGAKKSQQALLNRIEELLDSAIKKVAPAEIKGTITVPPYEPGAPATTRLTSLQQLGQPAPEPVSIPPEAYPQITPEMSVEERMAELDRARNVQEAAEFELQEQYAEPARPETQEVMKGEAYEPAPRAQGRLFTAAGKPTAAALRGQPVPRTEVAQQVADTDGQRGVGGVDVSGVPDQTRVEEVAGAEPEAVGDIAGPSEGAPVRRGRGVGTEPTALEDKKQSKWLTLNNEQAVQDYLINSGMPDVATFNQTELNQLHNSLESGFFDWQSNRNGAQEIFASLDDALDAAAEGAVDEILTQRKKQGATQEEAEPLTRAEANKKAERELLEGTRDEYTTPARNVKYSDEYRDPDEFLYSKSGKSKSKGKAPKQVPSLKELKTDKPSSVEAVEKAAERLFNPVWLKQARAQGWLHILPGTPADVTELANADVNNAQGVYMGRKGHVYIFPENIPQGGERGVLLHEIGEHKGLDEMIGAANVTRLANRVRKMAEGSDRDAEIAKRALERAEAAGVVDDKEIVAYFTEVAVNEAGIEPGSKPKPGLGKAVQWINELWNSIKNAMVKLAVNPNTITGQDLVDIVYGAARLQMGQEGSVDTDTSSDAVPEPEILRQSAPRNPAYALTDAERRAREAANLPVFPVPQRKTMREEMMDTMGLNDGMRNWLDKLGNAVVGPLFTLHRKSSAFYGPESFYSKTSGKLLGSLMAQHALNANNLTFDAVKNGTMQVDDRGFIETVNSKDNLQTLNQDYNKIIEAIMRDGASKAVAYQDAAVMILGPRYKALIKMGIKRKDEFSSEAMARADQLQKKYEKEYTQWRDRYNRMRNNKRELLIKTGLMSEQRADELLDKLEYVPLYRIKDSEGMDGVFMQNLLSAKGEQRLQFDTAGYDVADVMSNIAKNEMWLYKRAIYNHTTNLTADQVEEMGGGRHLKVRPKDAAGVITYMRDGKLSHFKFDDPNDMAAFISVPVINNVVVRAMTKFGQLLRKTITLTPSFVYRQVWQDVERAWMQAGTNQNFMVMLGTSIREQAKNARKASETETARQLRKRGVVGAIEYQDTFDNAMDELLGREPDTNFKRTYKALEFMERLAQNSDLAARAIVYDGAIKEGFSPGEAALRAQMMLNYQHRGTSPVLRTLLSTIPFINTKIQGEWRLVEALQGKIPGLPKEKARMLLASKIAKLMLFTTAYAMMRVDEDDYEQESEETRNRNFLFNVGGAPLKIPVAPEYLIPKVLAEQAVRNVMDAEFGTDRKTKHAVMSAFGELLLSPSDALPSVVRPLIENITNYSFFGDRALVGTNLLQKDVNQQYIKGQTSELAKYISDMMHAIGGDPLAISPIKIDNLINGLFGTFGRDVLFITNQLDAAITGEERPDLLLKQFPEVGAAFYNPTGSQRIADFYDLRERVMKRYNTYLDLRKNQPEAAKEYMQENKKYLQARTQISAIQSQLDALRKQRNRIIENKAMSGEEKREKIDALLERTNKVLGTRVQELEKRLD